MPRLVDLVVLHESFAEHVRCLLKDELTLVQVEVKHDLLLERCLKVAHFFHHRVGNTGDGILPLLLSLVNLLALLTSAHLGQFHLVRIPIILLLALHLRPALLHGSCSHFVVADRIFVLFECALLRCNALVVALNLLNELADVHFISSFNEIVLLHRSDRRRVAVAARLG